MKGTTPTKADESLIQELSSISNGANCHSVHSAISHYRNICKDKMWKKYVAPCEQTMRQYLAGFKKQDGGARQQFDLAMYNIYQAIRLERPTSLDLALARKQKDNR